MSDRAKEQALNAIVHLLYWDHDTDAGWKGDGDPEWNGYDELGEIDDILWRHRLLPGDDGSKRYCVSGRNGWCCSECRSFNGKGRDVCSHCQHKKCEEPK